jgi:hypothetical protein
MGFETIHAARHTHATESFPPRDGVGLVAGPSRKRTRRFGAPTDEAVNLFLDVDGRWFHGGFRISCDAGQSKDTENGLRDNLLIGFYLSFFDKKDLTSGIDWLIPCAMNAIETAPKSNNSRLKRIQKVSRILQFCVVVYFFAPLVVIVFNLKRVHLANGMISISGLELEYLLFYFKPSNYGIKSATRRHCICKAA